MVIALVLCLGINSACQPDPDSPLWLTIEARNTELAWTGTPDGAVSPTSLPTMSGQTGTPILTSVPQPSATPSIIEVTPLGGQPTWTPTPTPCPATAICEVGPLLTPPPPGDVQIEPGTYTPEWRQNSRKCESTACDSYGLITAGVTLPIAGYVVDENGWWWLCGEVLIDEGPGGAETCDHAMVWLSLGPEGKRWGEWISK